MLEYQRLGFGIKEIHLLAYNIVKNKEAKLINDIFRGPRFLQYCN
jgi:hypothetical protein